MPTVQVSSRLRDHSFDHLRAGTFHRSHQGQARASESKRRRKYQRQRQDEAEAAKLNISVGELHARRFAEALPYLGLKAPGATVKATPMATATINRWDEARCPHCDHFAYGLTTEQNVTCRYCSQTFRAQKARGAGA